MTRWQNLKKIMSKIPTSINCSATAVIAPVRHCERSEAIHVFVFLSN